MNNNNTLVDWIQQEALNKPQEIVYVFLKDGENESQKINYCDLDLRIRTLAAILQEHAKIGERVILTYFPGIEFICAFFSCLYAGVLAVPTYPVLNKHQAERFRAIIKNSQPKIILGTTDSLQIIHPLETELQGIKILSTDTISTNITPNDKPVTISLDDLAFLQYTSGSTGNPKGAMISHRNIIANAQAIKNCFECENGETLVSWLPMQHDMGLISSIIMPFLNMNLVFMPPQIFLSKPYLWLKAISKYMASYSGGPNFAYQH